MKKSGKLSTILGLIIFIGVVTVGMVLAFIMINKNNPNNSNEEEVLKSSLYEVDNYDNTYVYVNTNGKIVTIDGYTKIREFSKESALAKKVGEENYSVIDSKGNVIIESNKYDSIDDSVSMYSLIPNSNYVAEKNYKYALLSLDGKELTDFEYDYIAQDGIDNNFIYLIEIDDKYGVISNTGKVLIEPNYDEDEIQIYFKYKNAKFIIIQIGDKCSVYDTKDFSLIVEFVGKEIETDYIRWVSCKDSNTLYFFTGYKLQFKKDNCKAERNFAIDFSNSSYPDYYNNNEICYFAYYCSDKKYVVCDGKGNEIASNKSNLILGKDFMFAEENGNIYVYNKDKLVKTIENYSIDRPGNTSGSCAVLKNSDGYYDVFDKNGEKKSTDKYYTTNAKSEEERKSCILSGIVEQGIYSLAISGETNKYVAVLPSGEIVDTGNLVYVDFLYDYDKGDYSNEFIIAKDVVNDKYDIVDIKGNIIIDNILHNSEYRDCYVCSNLNYIITKDKDTDTYIAYNYKDKRNVIEAKTDTMLEYVKEYNIFKTNKEIYSLDGKVIYELKNTEL